MKYFKPYLLFIILVVVTFLLQTTVFQWLELGGTAANIILIVTVCMAMLKGSSIGCLTGFFCGLLMDIMYSSLIGMYAIILVIIAYLVGHFQESFYREDITGPAIVLAISDLIYGVFMFLVLFVTRNETSFFFFLRRIIIPEIIYTVIVGIFIYKLISLLDNKFNKKGSENLID